MATAGANESSELDLPDPSDNWELVLFLKELADCMTAEDIKTLKYLLWGFGGSGEKVLETIKEPIEFFKHLQHRCLLDRNNILFLQAVIWHLGRKDIYEKLVKFSRGREDMLHFYNKEDKPVNGHEYVHVHVAGQKKMNRNQLEELRSCVSRLLRIPTHFVVNTDIELTNSILVTFMIPEGSSSILHSMNDAEKSYLASKGIDKMMINGSTIKCTVTDDIEQNDKDSITKDSEITLLLKQKAKAEKEIEALQIRLLDKDKADPKKQDELLGMTVEEETQRKLLKARNELILQLIEANSSPAQLSLKDIALKNAQRYFRHALKKAEMQSIDRDLLNYIIEANTLFCRIQSQHLLEFVVAQKNAQIMQLNHEMNLAFYERDKLAYVLKSGVSNPILTKNEEFFFKTLGLPLPVSVRMPMPNPVGAPGIKISSEHQGEFDEQHAQQMLNKMLTLMDKFERSLTDTEKEKITKKFIGPHMRLDSKASLFRFLWGKEVQRKGLLEANLHKMMHEILTHIERFDMLVAWIKEATESKEKTTTQTKRRQPEIPKDQPSQMPKKRKLSSTNIPSENNMGDIVERLQRIEDMLKKDRATFGMESLSPFLGQTVRGSQYPLSSIKCGFDLSKFSQTKLVGEN